MQISSPGFMLGMMLCRKCFLCLWGLRVEDMISMLHEKTEELPQGPVHHIFHFCGGRCSEHAVGI